METAGHVPVLLAETVEALAPCISRAWVDCTLGLGGHAAALLRATPPQAMLLAMDVDPQSLNRARENLREFEQRIRWFQANFSRVEDVVRESGVDRVDAMLADLGVNSMQLDRPGLGLSFDRDEPLDMRLDPTLPHSAADLVNGLSESDLANLLYLESDERHSRKIAKRICRERRDARITSTARLARIVVSALGGRKPRGRVHPATRTFMALRIAVNHEGESLAALLDAAPRVLRPGGRLAVISFHSGEDRRVKESYRQRQKDGTYLLMTRRPVTPSASEIVANPRARSAKLRVAERTAQRLDDAGSETTGPVDRTPLRHGSRRRNTEVYDGT